MPHSDTICRILFRPETARFRRRAPASRKSSVFRIARRVRRWQACGFGGFLRCTSGSFSLVPLCVPEGQLVSSGHDRTGGRQYRGREKVAREGAPLHAFGRPAIRGNNQLMDFFVSIQPSVASAHPTARRLGLPVAVELRRMVWSSRLPSGSTISSHYWRCCLGFSVGPGSCWPLLVSMCLAASKSTYVITGC